MATPTAPPLAQTKAAILAKHDEDWFDEKMEEMNEHYGGAFKDKAFLAWLVATENDVPVDDIKASDNAEGEPITIYEIQERFEEDEEKTAKTFTNVVGGKFQKPTKEGQFQIERCLVMDIVEGETSKGTDKLDLIISDGTGTSKVVCYGGATELIANAKIRPGDVIRLPRLTGQTGHWTKTENGRKEPVRWWKFALAPFDSVAKLQDDLTDFVHNIDQVPATENMALYLDGMMLNIDAKKNDVCTGCNRWYDDEKEEEHESCVDDDGEPCEIEEQVTHEATVFSTFGQTRTLFFTHEFGKPKLKLRQLARFVGLLTKGGKVKVTAILPLDAEQAVKASRKAPEPPVVDEEPEGESPAMAKAREGARRVVARQKARDAPQDDDEGEEAPEPPVRTRRTRKTAKAAPEPTEDEEEREDAPAPQTRSRTRRKASAPVEEPEDDEDDAEEPEEAPAAPTRRRTARKAPEPDEEEEEDATTTAEAVEPSDEFYDGLVDICANNLTGAQEWPVVARVVVRKGLIPGFKPPQDKKQVNAAIKAAFQPYLDAAVEDGILVYANSTKTKIKLGPEGEALTGEEA